MRTAAILPWARHKETDVTVESRAHPWMAISAPGVVEQMLQEIGAKTVDELFEQVPKDHYRKLPPDLPPTLLSEAELRRDLLGKLRKNRTCEEYLNFLGAGCWQHHVPSVVEEIVGRTEFMTNVWGSPQSDVGRNQAWFEFSSQLGALLNMDVVQLPVYSWGCAAGHAIRMAARLTGRKKVLVPKFIDPERLSVIRTYCEPAEMKSHIEVVLVEADPDSLCLDMEDLKSKISSDVAAVYFENPSYVGMIEAAGAEIAQLARNNGAETIVGVDPVSLGVITAPGDYGADIAVGPTQPLGVHMNGGGGVGGFLASRDEEHYVRQFNGFLVSITETMTPGEYGFGLACAHQNSYGMREDGNDWTGNSVYLWAVANAVYMSLLGPQGFVELGQLIISRAQFAASRLQSIDGVSVSSPTGFFKEFVVNFDGTGKSVAEINTGLMRSGIFGGKDLSAEIPELGQSALYCVTEIHNAADIETLVAAMAEVVQ